MYLRNGPVFIGDLGMFEKQTKVVYTKPCVYRTTPVLIWENFPNKTTVISFFGHHSFTRILLSQLPL